MDASYFPPKKIFDAHMPMPLGVTISAENLMAFYQTALLLDPDTTQIEDIFCNNAENLFGKE